MNKTSDDLLLKVAAIAGWKDISMLNSVKHYFGTKNGDIKSQGLPNYTTSIDTVLPVYEELGLCPSINRPTYDGNYYVSVLLHHPISTQIVSANDPNLAIALCKLLVIISENIE